MIGVNLALLSSIYGLQDSGFTEQNQGERSIMQH